MGEIWSNVQIEITKGISMVLYMCVCVFKLIQDAKIMFTVLSTTLLHMYRIFILANTNIQNPLKIILFNFHFFAFTNSRDTSFNSPCSSCVAKKMLSLPFFCIHTSVWPSIPLIAHVFTVCVVPMDGNVVLVLKNCKMEASQNWGNQEAEALSNVCRVYK